MIKQISTRSAAIGASVLLVISVGGTVALNSSAASGATPRAAKPAAVRPAAVNPTGKATIYLKADPLVGASTTKGLEKWIPLTSIGSGFSTPTANGQITGRTQAANFTFDKAYDITTPQILATLATGKHLTKAEIRVYQSDPNGVSKLMTDYMFTDIMFVSDSFGQSSGSQAEHVSMIYRTMKITQTSTTSGVPNQLFAYDASPAV